MVFNTRTKIIIAAVVLLSVVGFIGVRLWFGSATRDDIVKMGENLQLPPIMSTPQFNILACGRREQFRSRGNEIIRS